MRRPTTHLESPPASSRQQSTRAIVWPASVCLYSYPHPRPALHYSRTTDMRQLSIQVSGIHALPPSSLPHLDARLQREAMRSTVVDYALASLLFLCRGAVRRPVSATPATPATPKTRSKLSSITLLLSISLSLRGMEGVDLVDGIELATPLPHLVEVWQGMAEASSTVPRAPRGARPRGPRAASCSRAGAGW